MAAPSNEELLREIHALGIEVRSLRDEVERLKRGPESLQKPATAAEKPAAARWTPHAPSAPATSSSIPPRRSAVSFSFDEKFIGEKMLQYVGIVILTLGIVFFLIWTAAKAGPEVRVLLAASAGAALIAAGLFAEKRPPYDRMSGTLIGGGWTTLFVTAYAAGHWSATKLLDSPATILGALFATGAGMIVHAVARRSRPLRLYAVSLTYFLMIFCGSDLPGFEAFVVLFTASAVIAVGAGEADVLVASLIGYYLNYIAVYMRTISLPPDQRTVANFIAPFLWLAIPYSIITILPLLPKARRLFEGEQKPIAEGALCLNSVLFALAAGSMSRVYFGVPQLPRAAALSAFFAVPSILYIRSLSKRSPAAGLNAILGLGLLAAAVFEMPDPMWKLLAWIVVSCSWVWVGLFFDQAVWRASGLLMAMLTFGLYWHVASLGGDSRRSASMALFLFTGLAYFFSRFHRLWLEEPAPWEKSSGAMWLHAGSLALLLGLWGLLDAAPFLCVLCALVVAAEYAAQNLRRVDLWQEAVLLEYGLGVYSFFVDYGADASVAGIPTRLLASALVVGTYAYLYFDGPVDDALAAEWSARGKSSLRAGLTWLAAAVAAFAVYREFDGRLRLPVWALWSLGLYWLGRVRRETCFIQQSVMLALFAAGEAVVTYLVYPSALLSPLNSFMAVFFWLSCAALLGGLFLAKQKRWGEPTSLDAQAAAALGFLPLALGACYLGKELDSLQLTLAWTALGLAFLIGGIALDWKELRRPALGLLGLCVAKALLWDTANLPLPYRVVSFVALGLVLLFGSSLYVRIGAKNEKTPPADNH